MGMEGNENVGGDEEEEDGIHSVAEKRRILAVAVCWLLCIKCIKYEL